MKRKNSKKDERKNSKNDENKNRQKDRKKIKKIIDDFHMQRSSLLNKIIFRCVVICTIHLDRFIVLIFDHKIHEKNTEE